MRQVATYGSGFNPVPFRIGMIPQATLALPRGTGAGAVIQVACTTQGHLGAFAEVRHYAVPRGIFYDPIGWVFPATGVQGRLWFEWAMLDGTLSRQLGCPDFRSFDDACIALLAAYQSPRDFGIRIAEYQGEMVKLN